MIIAVLDTNVILQSLIGGGSSASARTMQALTAGHFIMLGSAATFEELARVLGHEHLQARHRMHDEEIGRYIASLAVFAQICDEPSVELPVVIRDLSDRKFLSLALSNSAHFSVTNDRRHLFTLKQVGDTRIVTPTAFLRALRT